MEGIPILEVGQGGGFMEISSLLYREAVAQPLAEGLPGELRKSNDPNSGIWRTWWTGSSVPLPRRAP